LAKTGKEICFLFADATLANKLYVDSYRDALCSDRKACKGLTNCDRFEAVPYNFPMYRSNVNNGNGFFTITYDVSKVPTAETPPGLSVSYIMLATIDKVDDQVFNGSSFSKLSDSSLVAEVHRLC
jgi:hypothetical protein